MDPGLEGSLFTRLLDDGVDFLAALLHRFFDVGGMYTAVGNQTLEGKTRNFASYRVEAGDRNGFGRIVDNKIHTRERFDGADVAAFTTDNAALHFIVGQIHRRNGRFGNLIGGTALNGERNDVPRLFVRLLLALLLDLGNLHGCLMTHLGFDLRKQIFLGGLGGKAGDLLQFVDLLLFYFFYLSDLALVFLELLVKAFFFALAGLNLFVESLFLLLCALFKTRHFNAAILDLALGFVFVAQNFFFCFDQRFFFLGLGGFLRLVQDAFCLILGGFYGSFGDFLSQKKAAQRADGKTNDRNDDRNDPFFHLSTSF